MRESLVSAYDRIVLGKPRLVLVVMLALLAVFAGYAPHFKLDASADSLLLENDQDLQRFRNLAHRYGTKEFLFVTVTPKHDLFTAESLALVAQLRADLKAVPAVESVLTLLDVPLVKNVNAKLSEIAKKYRTLEAKDVDYQKAKDELTTSPLYRNVVISPDGRTTAIRVVLRDSAEYRALQEQRGDLVFKRATSGLSSSESRLLDEIEPKYQALKEQVDTGNHATIAALRTVLDRYADRAEIHLGGMSMITDDMISYVGNDIVVFGIGALVFAVLMLAYIFREARWVLIPLVASAYCIVVILGLLALVGWKLTVISSNFIALTLILTISTNIHLVVRYRELFRDHPDWSQLELVRGMAHDMVMPSLYTSLTSIIGFASLVLSSIKPIIDFGWMMTISLFIVFIFSFSCIPAMMVLMKKRPLRTEDSGTYGFTEWLATLTDKRGRLVLFGSVVITLAGIYGTSRLQVENSFISYFKQDTEIYQGLKLIDETMGGTTPLEIVLKFPPPTIPASSAGEATEDELNELYGEEQPSAKSDYWFTSEKVDRIKAVHDYLEKIPGVGKVTSLASIVRVAEDLNKGRAFDPLELNVIYKRLPENLKEEMLSPYLSIENDEARISLRILDSLPNLRRQALLTHIREGLQHDLGLKPDQFEVVGLLVLYNNMLQSLFNSQILSLGSAMLGVMLTLWYLFRNFRAAVIGVIPNIVAATTILGFMGLCNIPLDMMTIMIASLTIGIAVEDCIHYLYRYEVEYHRIGDYLKTMYFCHSNIAKAGFYTTLAVVCGFSILVLSNFVPTVLFGFLTTIAMSIALLFALTLMPKLILMWRPFTLKEPIRHAAWD